MKSLFQRLRDFGDRLQALSGRMKTAAVLGGYVLAFAIASIASYVHYEATKNLPDMQGGMAAEGDLLLFVFIFGLWALIPTALGLFFLRSVRAFWKALSTGIWLLVATGVISAFLYWTLRAQTAGRSIVSMLTMLSPLRMIISPLLALAFGVCAVFAPSKGPRVALALAAVCEVVVAAPWFLFLAASAAER